MAIEGGPPDGAPVTATSAPQTEAATTPDAGSGDAQSWDQLGWKNPDDLKRFVTQQRNEMRALKAELETLKGGEKPKAPAKSQPVASEVEALRAEMRFRDVVADVAPHLDRAKRERLQRLYAAEQPGTDLESWVRSEVAVIGWDKPAQSPAPAPAKPPEQVKQATNAGTPSIGGPGIDPHSLGPDGWKALSGKALRAAFDTAVSRDPSIGHKFAPRAKP